MEQASRDLDSRTALGEASGTTYSPKSVSYSDRREKSYVPEISQKAREREKEGRRREEESIEQTYAAVCAGGELDC